MRKFSRKKATISVFIYLLFILILTYIQKPQYCSKLKKRSPIKYDSSLDSFVQKAGLPVKHVTYFKINRPAKKLKVFEVSYNRQHDPAGDVYSSATGIKFGEKIGWIRIDRYANNEQAKFEMYDFESSDGYLYSEELFKLLKTKDEWVFSNAYLPLLAEDKDTPRYVLLNIARGNYSYLTVHLAESLLKNPNVKNDHDILTILTELPYPEDQYKQIRSKAQDLLK